jgi:hypothetical protein
MNARAPTASPGSPERRAEANRLTGLMERTSPFTYLRLGDGELSLLISWQEGNRPQRVRDSGSSRPIFHAQSVNGLKEQDYPRLLHAYENCNYLDTFLRVPYSAENYQRLRLNRSPLGINSPTPDLSQIFYEWGYCELAAYIKRHRCVFAGAEAPLLSELLADRRYQRATEPFWKFPVDVICVGVRDDGRNYWEALDDIKSDLMQVIREAAADTLFLSLASGAKILCQEIARELGIRCFDLGAISLALTYSATPGNSIARNSHNPFYFRVPLDVYIDCLTRAYPKLPMASLVAKAQAQLCLDLLRKEPMNSFVPEINQPSNFDPTPNNVEHFHESLRAYNARFGTFLRSTAVGRQLASEFRAWRIERGLGIMGKMFTGKRYAVGIASRCKRRVLHLVNKCTQG